MEEQVPMSQSVPPSQAPEFMPEQPQITPETLAKMKAIAKERAVRMVATQQQLYPQQEPKVVYVRRNLTVAELLLIILLSCGIVTGIQYTWNFATNVLPRIEIKMK
jgi:hypothetical protein